MELVKQVAARLGARSQLTGMSKSVPPPRVRPRPQSTNAQLAQQAGNYRLVVSDNEEEPSLKKRKKKKKKHEKSREELLKDFNAFVGDASDAKEYEQRLANRAKAEKDARDKKDAAAASDREAAARNALPDLRGAISARLSQEARAERARFAALSDKRRGFHVCGGGAYRG